jgi:DNA primase
MPGLIPPATLEQIRAASDIVEVIGAVVPLKRAGVNFSALCPFHKEKSPSFNVNPGKQIFKCFGCGKGGDVFTFIREYESVSFVEAVRRLAERARIPLEFEQGADATAARSLKEQLLEIHEQITQRWQAALTNDAGGQIARDYLAKRGVPDEAVKLFRLGYAPDAWDDTVNWAKSRNFEPELIEKAGLVIRRDGGGFYDRFRGRLMFPICDDQGRVIGFSGRVLSGDEKTAKYVNSPETPIFTKGRVMFGLDKAKRPMLDAGRAIVCEGQLDLIACHTAGIRNVVAPQGTAFTGEHARILKRYVDEVVLCFDSDNAGQKAAVRALDDLLASGLAIRVATMPAPHDPDSFIKERGGEAMRQLLDGAVGFFDFFLERLCTQNDLGSDRGRVAVARAMADAVRKTGNAVLLDTWAQKTAQRLGVTPDAMRAEFRKAPTQRQFRAPEQDLPGPDEADLAAEELAATPPPSPFEAWLLRLAFGEDDLIQRLAAALRPEWIQNETVKRLVFLRLARHTAGSWHGAAALMSELDDADRELLSAVLADPKPATDPLRQLDDTLTKLRNQYLDSQLMKLSQQMNSPTASDEEKFRCAREHRQLSDLKRRPILEG